MTTSYSLFAELFRHYFAWPLEEDDERRVARIVSRLEELVGRGALSAERAAEIGPLLSHLLSLPFGNEWVDYKENSQVSTMYSGGIIGKPQKIDWYRLILDPDQCKFMAEIVITDPAHPYVLATQASVAGGTAMGPFNTIVTDAGDWLFDANSPCKGFGS